MWHGREKKMIYLGYNTNVYLDAAQQDLHFTGTVVSSGDLIPMRPCSEGGEVPGRSVPPLGVAFHQRWIQEGGARPCGDSK